MISILRLAWEHYGNLFKAFFSVRHIVRKRRMIHGNKFTLKYVYSDERYFFALNVPGWPSSAFNSFINNELRREDDEINRGHNLLTAIFSISNRCTLQCEHCYEWDHISVKEILTIEELMIIQKELHALGVCQLEYSGGEPLCRLDALLALLSNRKEDVDYWILSSGFGLTPERAKCLKDGGLTGAVISLDHWDEEGHNSFRNNPNSFTWVRDALRNCKDSKLTTGVSICATREFITERNLWEYAGLSKSWGAGFIRILEPRQVGSYKGNDVLLQEDHLLILEKFFLEINSNRRYSDYPIVLYPGYHQRKTGCMGAGDRYIFIDSKGDIHACPFCQDRKGNALTDNLNDSISLIREKGCHKFDSALQL